ncbi:MAG: hypothetical protein SFU99_18750 [Saprospiraceae bacterium]|nr:hypothetical protein [Saprospiraceae bacterium]
MNNYFTKFFLPPIILIVSTYISEIIFNASLSEAVIAGLSVVVITYGYQILQEVKDHKGESLTISSHIKEIVGVLKIHNAFFDEKWLKSIFSEIVEIIQTTKNNPHDLQRVRGIVSKSIQESKEAIGSPFFIEEKNELERMVHINRAMNNAQKYVSAVTVDVNDYFENFWQGANESYINENIAASKRGVFIERIFVMEEKFLKSNSKENKAKKLRVIINSLKRSGKNIKIYITSLEKIRQQSNLNNVSFFICDDVVASEAGDDIEYFGYFSHNKPEVVENLRDRFEAIKLLSREI